MNVHHYNKKFIVIFSIGTSIILLKMLERKRKVKRKDIKINAISFGPTGANFSYQLGITKYIQNNFNLNNFKYAAVSGGTHSAFCLGLNIDIDTFFFNFTINTFNKNNNKNKIFDIARDNAKIFKKKDNNFDKNIYVGLTKIFPYLHSKSISKYNDYDDMIECMLASQCIPYVNCNLPYYTFRNNLYIDGFLCNCNFMPVKSNWHYIDIYDFKKNASYFEYLFSGIYNLKYLCNEDFHYNQYIQGFNDAKKRHKHFLDIGFIEK